MLFIKGVLLFCLLMHKVHAGSAVLTLCDPTDYISPDSLSMGLPTQEYWTGLPFPSLGALLNPGTEPSCPAGGFFTTEPPGKRLFINR